MAGCKAAGTDCLEIQMRAAVQAGVAAAFVDAVMRRLDDGSTEHAAAVRFTACAETIDDEQVRRVARRKREVPAIRASYALA